MRGERDTGCSTSKYLILQLQECVVRFAARAPGSTMPLLLDYVTERVPHELICSICGDVMQRAVRTPCDHHFCERDLLEWFCRVEGDDLAPAQRCPQCNQTCDPNMIVPARVVRNLCGELLRKCDRTGCSWIGTCAEYASHTGSAQCQSGGEKTGGGAPPTGRDKLRPRRRRLYLEQKLEDVTATENLQRRQLAEMVQTNKELRDELERVKKESSQRLERCRFLENALLGESAQSNLELARAQALREARKVLED